jgi:hypothetical protein
MTSLPVAISNLRFPRKSPQTTRPSEYVIEIASEFSEQLMPVMGDGDAV